MAQCIDRSNKCNRDRMFASYPWLRIWTSIQNSRVSCLIWDGWHVCVVLQKIYTSVQLNPYSLLLKISSSLDNLAFSLGPYEEESTEVCTCSATLLHAAIRGVSAARTWRRYACTRVFITPQHTSGIEIMHVLWDVNLWTLVHSWPKPCYILQSQPWDFGSGNAVLHVVATLKKLTATSMNRWKARTDGERRMGR